MLSGRVFDFHLPPARPDQMSCDSKMTKSITLPLAALFQFLAMLFPAAAEHIYIAQTARGANTGTDAANAHAYTWFNDDRNWTRLPPLTARSAQATPSI